jgi:choice-of-anchor A domain-containing protein
MAIRDMMNITAPKKARQSRLSVQTLEAREVPASGLGVASNFSAFYFEDVNAYYSDIQGRVAVGGNASFTGYSVGDKLTNSHGTRDDLIVGKSLDYTNGQVFNGNTVYGTTVHTESFGHPNGDIHKGAPLDFAAAKTELTNLSNGWKAMPSNGTVSDWYGALTLKGTKAGANVFSLTAAQLWDANGITIKAPVGSTVVVNISGTDARMQFMGFNLEGVKQENVVFNFNQATKLQMQGIGLKANVMAPNAAFQFDNGAIHGTVIAKSMCGYGEIEYTEPKIDCVPPPPPCAPCPGNTIKGVVFYDKDNDGVIDAGENGLGQIKITITGTDKDGKKINKVTYTDTNGNYAFDGLKDGVYTIRSAKPNWMHGGKSSAGSFGGKTGVNSICHIDVKGCGLTSTGYNFGELCGCTDTAASYGL